MQHWTNCSPPSASCRFEWSPAPEIGAALFLLGLLAGLSLWMSNLPRPWLWWAMPAAVLWGLLQARSWQRRPATQWLVDRQRQRICRNGAELDQARVSWRCGIVTVAWSGVAGSGAGRCLFLPWRLPGEAIRELRQWPAHSHARDPVAP